MKGIPDWAIALGVIALVTIALSSNKTPKPDPVPTTPVSIESTSTSSSSPSPSLTSSCPTDVRSLIMSFPDVPEPLGAGRMFPSIQQGKDTLTRIVTNPACNVETEKLSSYLKQYWGTYIALSYRQSEIFAMSNKGLCTSAFNCDSSCYRRCEEQFKNSLEDAGRSSDSESQSMRGFFDTLRNSKR